MWKWICAIMIASVLCQLAHADSQRGTVVGTVTLEGKTIKLGYIYAQRREALPEDAQRFGLKEGETLDAGVVDLIATDQPITQDMIDAIPVNKYNGSDLRGVWLLLDLSNQHSSADYFLVTAGALPTGSGTVMISTQGNAQIEHGKLTGKLESRVQEVSTVKAYSILFDTPLHISPYRTSALPASEETLNNLQTVLPGTWVIARWWAENGSATKGALSIDQKTNGNEWTGVFRFPVSKGQEVEESVAITLRGPRIHFEGSVAPGINWYPDTLDLELRGDLLIGSSRDTAGTSANVVLRKVQ